MAERVPPHRRLSRDRPGRDRLSLDGPGRDRPPSQVRTWCHRLLAAVPAVSALLAAACAQMPSAGPVQSAPAPQGGRGTNCCALVMSGPQPGWSPTDIVSGFLLASASFAHGNAIAREYLTAGASRSWRPGSAVTIVDQSPSVVQQARQIGSQSTVTVVASGRVVATVTSSGQYKPVTGGGVTARQEDFIVERVKGQWRIAGLPGAGRVTRQLLLPQSLFNLVYKPQNLYFYARGSGDRVLIPDPVFVPSDSSDPATRLVGALMNGVPGWLEGAAVSAVPAHTKLLGVQVLPGAPANKTAIVSLSLPQHAVRPATLRALDAQLVWTLTSRAYAGPLIHAVKLRVNGRFWPASGSAVLDLADYRDRVPGPPAQQALYFVGSDGKVRVLGQGSRGSEASSLPVPGTAPQARVAMNTIAVSPDRHYLAGVGDGGTTVYAGNLPAAGVPHPPPGTGPQARLSGSSFTTPSWDSADNLWVAGRVRGTAGVWVLPHGQGPPHRVSLPPSLGQVTALRVAPDGVRLAMIVGHGPKARLVIAAIVRAGGQYLILHTLPAGPNLTGPSAVAWYDPDHLLAVTGTGPETQLWEVPLNGNAATRQGAVQPGIASVAAAGPGNALYLSLSTGRVERSAGFGEFWSDVTEGSAATYPG